MRSIQQMLRYSSGRFLVYRALEVIGRRILNALFALAWRGSLGACGPRTRIDHGVVLVLPRLIRLGSDCYVASGAQLTTEATDANLEIGDNAVVAPGVRIDYTGGVTVGPEVLISEGVQIFTHDHDTVHFKKVHATPLKIGRHVWFGARAIVLPSVSEIGDGAVIGAGTVVTKNVAPGAIVVGNPGREVKKVGVAVSNG